jgi:hypothetical protein
VYYGVPGESAVRVIRGICEPFDIEPEYLDPVVVLSIDSLFPGVELLHFVNILATGVASPANNLESRTHRSMNRVLA